MKLSTKMNLIVSFTITVIIVAIFFILARQHNTLINHTLQDTARAFYKKIIVTRAWVAQNNGVYVKKTENVKSNPYLIDPDIETIDHQIYTLKNPALVTRELSELSENTGGRFQFHITSLNPVNPNNAPNSFERQALESFENQPKNNKNLEYSRVERINDKKYFRYFGPLFTEISCLTCHRTQGYRVGDIRGGISVILPMDTIEASRKQNYLFMIISGILTILILSFTVNFMLQRVVIRPLQKIKNAAKALEEGKYLQLDTSKNDEIGDLAYTFQSMQQKIQQYTRNLEHSEKKYRTLLNNSPEAVLIVNDTNQIIDANENINQLSNYKAEEILTQSIENLLEPEKRNKYQIFADQENHFETTLYCKDETEKPIEVYVSPEYYVTGQETNLRLFYLRDITERKRMERYMVESEKMFALHQLSSGIAHEIRNPLFGIRNNMNYLKENLKDNTEFKDIYSEINTGLTKINTLVNSILDFARPHRPEFKSYSLEKVIHRALKLIRKQFEAAGHEVIIKIPPELPSVEIDPHKLEQVFINLGTNSLQAMPQKGRFQITIIRSGKKLKIIVSDTGIGIDKKDISLIFDPFYTRSPQGTGLGLSIVKSIIRQHNGEINVISKKNQGTTFEIILPLKQN